MEWILCSYCHLEYQATLDGCPHCGMPETTEEAMQRGLAEARAREYRRSDRVLGVILLAFAVAWLAFFWAERPWTYSVIAVPCGLSLLGSLYFFLHGPRTVTRFFQWLRRSRS